MAREEENVTLEGLDQDEEMPTVSKALASATATASASASSSATALSLGDSGSEEEADELRIQALEQALRSQPMDYDSHLQYVTFLRKSGEIEKLRNAREEMNKLFPLSPKLWQDWIGDEISLNQGAEAFADHGRVEVDVGKQLEKEEESKEIEKPKPESYNDQCMAFFSSLNLRTKEEDLKSFFSDCGSVTAVQLVRDKVIGKSWVSSSRRHIDFPDHLLHKKILPCLPFKYLNRLKCISKELHSLISTDAKFAADQSRSADTSSSGFVYMSLDGVLSFFPDPTLIGVPDPSLNFLKPTSSDDEIYLVSCTNGLLLLDGEFSHKASLCVCNPATKEMVFVPKSVSWNQPLIYKTGLAYDPCELPDRFIIVYPRYNINAYQFNVFCSDTGKWTQSTSACVGRYFAAVKAVYANGVIYWDCGEFLLWYDTKRDLAGSLMWPLMKPLMEERFHIGVYAGEITCCLTWVGGIKVWRLTGGSCWDRLHATSWDGMLDALNFCEGMQLCCKSQYEMFFSQHIIFPVGFDGQFVYITVRLRKDKLDKLRCFGWETETGRVEERSPIPIWEAWYSNKIFKYANSMARVPQILKEIS